MISQVYSLLTHFVMIVLSFQDLENEDKIPHEQVSVDEILEMQREEHVAKQAADEKKKKALVERGLIPHSDPIQEEF